MKKYFVLLAVLLVSSVVLMACGDDNNNSNNANNEEKNNEENNDNNNQGNNDVNNQENNEDDANNVFGDDNNEDDNSVSFGDNDENNTENDDQATEEEGERTFVMEDEGVSISLTYYHEGDQVVKQTTENVISYEASGLGSKEDAQEMLEPESEVFQGIEGVSENIEYGDSKAVETMEIDYQEVDLDEIDDLPGMMQDGNTEAGISMQQSADMLLQQGFEEK